MANYVKDIKIVNTTINLATLEEFTNTIQGFADEMNMGRPPGQPDAALATYVIRYDKQGDRFFFKEQMIEKFKAARTVERIVLGLDTEDSVSTRRYIGTYIELTLDDANPNCFLTVSSDDSSWVDAKFAKLSSILSKTHNKNGLFRNRASQLLVQCMGVIICFLLSLTVARNVAPSTRIENAFLLCFTFAFMLSANLWNYLQVWVLVGIRRLLPNVRFVKSGREHWHWLAQGVAGTIVIYLLGWILERAIAFVGFTLQPLLAPGILP